MKRERRLLVGCGHRSNHFYNHEGYSDPTAGYALEGCDDIYGAPIRREDVRDEEVVIIRIPPVSEMAECPTNKDLDNWEPDW